jgi:hypothetical protein
MEKSAFAFHLDISKEDTRIPAAPLAIKPFLERDLRDPPGRVQVDALTPGAPDATPPVAQALSRLPQLDQRIAGVIRSSR